MARSWIGWTVDITEICSKKLPGDFFNTIGQEQTSERSVIRLNKRYENPLASKVIASVWMSCLAVFAHSAKP